MFTFALQGTGRYAVYVANYARGNIGPHVLLEMDEAASDVTRGIVALSDVAAKARVNKLTGQLVWMCVVKSVRLKCPKPRVAAFAHPAGGRGVVVGPILNQWRSDIFCDNENGQNFLYKNNGDGTFVDVAQRAGEWQIGSKQPESTRSQSCDVINHKLSFIRPTANALTSTSANGFKWFK